MKRNIGNFDRTLRIIIGVVIIAIGIFARSWWGLIGLLPLITAATGFCGLYTLLGISTCRTKAPRQN